MSMWVYTVDLNDGDYFGWEADLVGYPNMSSLFGSVNNVFITYTNYNEDYHLGIL